MTIDWLTVAAQILNFLILVGLLKHFLYRPILDGIDAREQEITTRMGEAASIKAQAQTVQHDYQLQIEQLQQQQSDTLAGVRQAAEREGDAMLDEVRQRIVQEQRAATHQRQRQAQQFVRDLNEQAGQVLLGMTRKALSELSDEALEERLVLHALSSLRQEAPERGSGQDPARRDATTTIAEVCTREPLSDTTRARVQASVATHWPGLTLSFTSKPEQSPGALVQLGSVQVDWTIDTYVTDLGAALTQKLVPEVEPAA